MRAKRHKWTAEQAELVKELAPKCTMNEIAETINRKFGLSLNRNQIKKFYRRHGLRGMSSGWKKKPEQIARDIPTKFKKGHTAKSLPVGTERTYNGATLVKVNDKGKKYFENWKYKQRMVWEREHGEIPEGCGIIFLDGDTANFDINNLACCTIGERARLTVKGMRFKDRELTRTALNVEKVISKIEEREGK